MIVFLTEQMVFNEPEGMEGWRCYRMEYGGYNQYCLAEGLIWLPGYVDPEMIEEFLEHLSDDTEGTPVPA